MNHDNKNLLLNRHNILHKLNISLIEEENKFKKYPVKEFVVKKIMKLTDAQRILRITIDGIFNCKPNGIVTTSHDYDHIKINLISTNRFQFIDKTSDIINLYETKDALSVIGYIERYKLSKTIVYFKNLLYESVEKDENIFGNNNTYLSIEKLKQYINNLNDISSDNFNVVEKLVYNYLFDNNNDTLISELVQIFFDTFDCETNHIDILIRLRCVLTFLKERIISLYKDEIIKYVNSNVSIHILVERLIQRSMVMLVYSRLKILLGTTYAEENTLIEKKKMIISELYRSGMGINTFKSNNWSFSIINLNNISSLFRPYEQIHCIVSSIYSILNTRRLELLTDSSKELRFSDFLKILFFVIANSTVEECQSLYYMVMLLSDPSEVNGEIGYIATLFFSVIECIKLFELDNYKIKKKNFKRDQISNMKFDSILNDNLNYKVRKNSMTETINKEMNLNFTTQLSALNHENIEKNMNRLDYFSVPLLIHNK